MNQLIEHANLLEAAAQRRDFKYVHDFAFYVNNLAQALYSALEDAQKDEAQASLTELLQVVKGLDSVSGRRLEEATLEGTRRVVEIVNELDSRLRPGKKTTRAGAGAWVGFELKA